MSERARARARARALPLFSLSLRGRYAREQKPDFARQKGAVTLVSNASAGDGTAWLDVQVHLAHWYQHGTLPDE